jgi:hypothetical protein
MSSFPENTAATASDDGGIVPAQGFRMGSSWLEGAAVILAYALVAVTATACEPPSYGEEPADASERAPRPADTLETSPMDTPPDATRDNGTGAQDAGRPEPPPPSQADASVEASTAPTVQTLTLGVNDCGGGHCNGGYDNQKDSKQLPTATKQCQDRGFTRATDFTIGGQPGGRFCIFNGSVYGCDSSCDGCNLMTTITCVK